MYDAGRDRTWLPPRLSALGQWIVALLLLLGLLGLSNRAEAQVSISQITNTGVVDFPSINADGGKIAFKSNGNLTGENPDGNDELFLATVSGTSPPPTTGTLQVTVRRSDTQAALPGALVTVSSSGTLQSQTTGSSGVTTFSDLQAGSYTVTASLTGFQASSTTAVVSANTTTSAIISLTQTGTGGTLSGWQPLPGGGQIGSQPAAVVDSTGTLRLYIQGVDNGLWAKQKSRGHWSDWSLVAGGGSLDGPAAFLDGSAVRLVVRGLDNSLWAALADTPTWEHLGGRTERSPVALMHAGSPFIYICGLDGRLYEALRDQTGVWNQWAEVSGGGQSSGQPAAVVDSAGTLHLYIQGIDNSLWTNQVSPTLAWGQWTAGVGGKSSVGPAAVLDGDKVRLVVRGLDNWIHTTLASDTQATQWSSWENLGGQTLNTPAVIRDGNTLHFFIRGIDGRLYMNSRTGGNGSSDSEHGEE